MICINTENKEIEEEDAPARGRGLFLLT
jgi:hypothetical protein